MNTILEAVAQVRPSATTARLREAESRYHMVKAVFSPDSAEAEVARPAVEGLEPHRVEQGEHPREARAIQHVHGRHVEALGELLQRSGDTDHAGRALAHYQKLTRPDSAASRSGPARRAGD